MKKNTLALACIMIIFATQADAGAVTIINDDTQEQATVTLSYIDNVCPEITFVLAPQETRTLTLDDVCTVQTIMVKHRNPDLCPPGYMCKTNIEVLRHDAVPGTREGTWVIKRGLLTKMP